MVQARKGRRRSGPRKRAPAAIRYGAWTPSTRIMLAGLALLVACAFLPALYHLLHGSSEPRRPPPLTMDEARALNAAIPFVAGPLPAAPPFMFHGTPAAQLQATDCLATAAIYEAGDDVRAQRAVIQVILNRVRRVGFPKTVCGVVYQGAALKTGCQFSFACDGSVQRRTEHEGWDAARALARHALGGAVFAPVGTATHYHADWTVPWWASSLDKIAKVRSHIFYRPRPPQGT